MSDEFAFITQAYKILKNPSTRATYDREQGLNSFPDLRSTWAVKTGKSAPGNATSNPISGLNFRSLAHGQSFEELQAERSNFADELYTYFKDRHDGVSKNTDEETQDLLSIVFRSVRKLDIETMMKNPHFDDMMKFIFEDPAWKHSHPTLLGAFLLGDWLPAMWWTQERDVGSFLGKFNPEHPAIQTLVHLFNSFSAKNREGREKLGRLGNIFAYMLREEPYRGTPAGKWLLDQTYRKWKDLGDDYLGKINRDTLTPKLLSLLDYPEWRNNWTLAVIAKVPPKDSQYSNALKEYEELRNKYPDIFPAQVATRPAPTTRQAEVSSSNLYGQRPKGGGDQAAYEQAYRFAITPISEGGLGMRDIFAHEWASAMSKRENAKTFSAWRMRFWTALDFALKKGDTENAAGAFAWRVADSSTSKEIDDIISHHYQYEDKSTGSRPPDEFGERFRKKYESSQTPTPSEKTPGQAHTESGTAHQHDPTAECMRNMMDYFLDPFGFFKKK
jgi:hypothetical protein